jgi:hypothetical protein
MRLFFLLVFTIFSLVSCANDTRRKRVPPPEDDGSKIGWNRPQAWEGQGAYGGMLPQNR